VSLVFSSSLRIDYNWLWVTVTWPDVLTADRSASGRGVQEFKKGNCATCTSEMQGECLRDPDPKARNSQKRLRSHHRCNTTQHSVKLCKACKNIWTFSVFLNVYFLVRAQPSQYLAAIMFCVFLFWDRLLFFYFCTYRNSCSVHVIITMSRALPLSFGSWISSSDSYFFPRPVASD
jgi:hypothetical protein